MNFLLKVSRFFHDLQLNVLLTKTFLEFIYIPYYIIYIYIYIYGIYILKIFHIIYIYVYDMYVYVCIHMMHCAIWYQTLKYGVRMVCQNAVLTS